MASTEEQAGEEERVELVRGRRLLYPVRVCVEQVKRYHIMGNFRGRKFFEVLWLFVKVFSVKLDIQLYMYAYTHLVKR